MASEVKNDYLSWLYSTFNPKDAGGWKLHIYAGGGELDPPPKISARSGLIFKKLGSKVL